jgi:GH25 family lysozyme M1 (1,4-beta-N-acetylmuramidase)
MQATIPKLYGVDLSHDDGDVDLHQLVAAGNLSFIGLKATEGTSFVDPLFVDRFTRIKLYLPSTYVIPYHFLRTDSGAADQMGHFVDVLKSVGYFDLPRALRSAIDSERGLQGQTPDGALTQSAVNAFKALTGDYPGIYSGLDYWQTQLAGVQCAYRWVARYADAPPTIDYAIWQDSEQRVIAGKAYDHDVAFMTLDQFLAKLGR